MGDDVTQSCSLADMGQLAMPDSTTVHSRVSLDTVVVCGKQVVVIGTPCKQGFQPFTNKTGPYVPHCFICGVL